MAYGRSANPQHNTWFQEQMGLVNTASSTELESLMDQFDRNFQDTVGTIERNYNGLNVMRDAKRMMESDAVMQEYKTLMLEPILKDLRDHAEATTDAGEKVHLESVAEQLDNAWEESKKSFIIQESYNTSTYLPLSTLDFPALIKQYIKFLGKDIIPVQTASSINIEQRIFIKYLVNNQTGEEFETPKIYFQKEADGTPTWKKLWNAGKGLRINDTKPLLLTDIQNATNKKFNMLVASWLLDENGLAPAAPGGAAGSWVATPRTRLSYDFNIRYVYISQSSGSGESATTKYYKVKLPGGGINIDIQSGGTFLSNGITTDTKLTAWEVTESGSGTSKTYTVSDTPTTLTGIADRLSGVVDFVKGTVSASACGTILGFFIDGHISNETNMRTIGFREYPEIRKFLISDGCRFQLPFTVEDFAEANASLNFNLYNRLVQELVGAQEMFEDESILEFLDEEFAKYDGAESDVWALESYTHTEYVDLDPASMVPNFAGDPWEFRTNAIQNAITSVIYELCDRGKMDNLGFVIYCNPKAARLLKKFVTWTVQKNATIGGVQMNHSFGVMTDENVPIRVVASNRVDAYIKIPAYQSGTEEGDESREYFYKIVAYPMDKFHIGYKHLRFARHLTNSPENAAYADAQNPGGAAVYVTTSSQYKTIAIQGIQGRVICKNTTMVPDSMAGPIVAAS